MKTKLTLKFAKYAMFLLLLAAFNPRLSTWAQGTAFTYQGRLNDGGIPATGNYDLAFTLYSAISGGRQSQRQWPEWRGQRRPNHVSH